VNATAAPNGRTRVHLVYPHGPRTGTPDSIGREVGRRLEARYDVTYYNWVDRGVITPGPGDVLVGHPHPDPGTIFRRSLGQSGWRRRLLLAPYHHGDLRQNAFEDPIVRECDLVLAITGPYWFRTTATSDFSHWLPKMIHVDMAIDRSHYPPIKTAFAAPGSRRVLYIGRTGRGKGTEYLSEIAALLPDVEFARMGPGTDQIPGFKPLGFVDYDAPAGRDLIASYDFFLTVGNADANPTTILEAMSWGLIPICTPTSGYDGIPGIVNVPARDPAAAAAVLRGLETAAESKLLEMQSANWQLLDRHYTWDRFAAQVADAIESGESPRLGPESIKRRLQFGFYEMTSPHGRLPYSPPARLVSRLRRAIGRPRTTRGVK